MIYYYEWFWRQKYQHNLSFDTMHSFDSGGGTKGSWVWLKGVMCSPTRLPLAFIFSLRGTFWRIFFTLRFDELFFSRCVFCASFFYHFKSNSSIVVSMELQSNLAIRNFWVNAKLFTNVRLFIVYEVNWQIVRGKWFTIAMLFTI